MCMECWKSLWRFPIRFPLPQEVFIFQRISLYACARNIVMVLCWAFWTTVQGLFWAFNPWNFWMKVVFTWIVWERDMHFNYVRLTDYHSFNCASRRLELVLNQQKYHKKSSIRIRIWAKFLHILPVFHCKNSRKIRGNFVDFSPFRLIIFPIFQLWWLKWLPSCEVLDVSFLLNFRLSKVFCDYK